MYINENIKLRDDLPERLKSLFRELQEYYDAGNWLNYDLLLEAFEISLIMKRLIMNVMAENDNKRKLL